MKAFNDACKFHDLELVIGDYTPGTAGDIEYEQKEITVKRILPKININEYSVKTFREKLESFTKEDLEVFIENDTRATIIKEAKKELKIRK